MEDHLIRMMQLSQKGYYCSQIILALALETRGMENPDLIRAMAGPANGCSTGKATCGSLIGGCCMIAFYAAKGADDETESDRYMLMVDELTQWFSETVGEHHGGIKCNTILGMDNPKSAMQKCGNIVAQTYEKAMEILISNGIDPME
jgi:C_GCAxxG_C_C family probable redox protein